MPVLSPGRLAAGGYRLRDRLQMVLLRPTRWSFASGNLVSGEEIARRLEDNNIITNYQALPDDDSFVDSSGIRMGTQEMTRFGMKEKDFELLAEYLADCLKSNKPVKNEVTKLRQKFLVMQYCLPVEKSLPLAAKVLSSILPGDSYLNKFADNLRSCASR